jgi:hypothetical protein
VNVVIDMDQVSRMRMRAAWFRDVPRMLVDAELYEWGADHIQGVEADLAEALSVLRECEEYFDDRADAEILPGGYSANNEMRLLVAIRAILAKNARVSQEI